METIKDFEDDIYKCSKCAMCQSVCPVYKITGDESCVSKGKFIMLNGAVKGDLEYGRGLKKYLDLCLNCSACKKFCPSGIDVKQIFAAARHECNLPQRGFPGCFVAYSRAFQESASNAFFKFGLFFAKVCFSIYRLLKIDFLVSFFEPLLLKSGILGKRILLLNSVAKMSVKRNFKKAPKNKEGKNTLKVVYFEGCFTKYINPSTKNAVLNILHDEGIELIKADFECCAIGQYFNGNFEEYKKSMSSNLKKLNALEDFDYLLFDCASCLTTVSTYDERFRAKCVDFLELLKIIDYKVPKMPEAAYHKPCHLEVDVELLFQSTGFKFVNPEDYEGCCGFAGKFAMRKPDISLEISGKRARNLISKGPQYIITSCPSCIMGLNQGLIENKSNAKVLSVAEFLSLV